MCLLIIQSRLRKVIVIFNRIDRWVNLACLVINWAWIWRIFVQSQLLLLNINSFLIRFIDTRNRVLSIGAVACTNGGILMYGAIYPGFNTVIELVLVVIHKAQCFRFEVLIREKVVWPLSRAALYRTIMLLGCIIGANYHTFHLIVWWAAPTLLLYVAAWVIKDSGCPSHPRSTSSIYRYLMYID